MGTCNENHKFTKQQLRYFVSIGPLQVKLENYPQKEELRVKRTTCKFSTKWYTEYPYLEYSQKKDAAFCFICRLFSDGNFKL